MLNLSIGKSQNFENFKSTAGLNNYRVTCMTCKTGMFQLQKYTAATFNIKENKKENGTKRMWT